MNDVADVAPGLDSDSCLCVVASFVSAARTVGDVTAEAAKRIMMSPVLSDIIEFRFVSLGPTPSQGADQSVALRAITEALLGPRAAGRNYSAIVVMDRSAVLAEQILLRCTGSPFVAALRPRSLGIANADDRLAHARSDPATSIVTSPTGVWAKRDDMVAVLYRFADQLQRSLAVTQETGLTAAELDALRARYQQHAPRPAAGPATLVQADGVAPAVTAAPQAPAGATLPPVPVITGAPQMPVITGRPAPPGAVAPASAEPREPLDSSPPARRRLLELRWPRGKQAEDAAASRADRLVYLLIVGDESARDEAALNRSRSALLDVDKRLASMPEFRCQVRLLHGDENGLHGELREAGQLSRRDVRKTAAGDFAAVLEQTRAWLRRDRAGRDGSPLLVLFTAEPPFAETAAVRLFRELAHEAMVAWALPRTARALLSGSFADSPGVRVVADDQGVADEIAVLLGDIADVPPTVPVGD